MNAPNNPLAFPSDDGAALSPIDLRDWFAGQALAGILSHNKTIASQTHIVQACYLLADAMLAEREKRG